VTYDDRDRVRIVTTGLKRVAVGESWDGLEVPDRATKNRVIDATLRGVGALALIVVVYAVCARDSGLIHGVWDFTKTCCFTLLGWAVGRNERIG
jgi:hypothetical protein